MFKIVDSTFHVTRGDTSNFDITASNYTFQGGEKVSFKVYEANGFEDQPLLNKSITVTSAGDSVNFALTSADTNIGGYTSEVIDYWYEVKLDDDITLVGYDSSGPKIFTLYPAGKESV